MMKVVFFSFLLAVNAEKVISMFTQDEPSENKKELFRRTFLKDLEGTWSADITSSVIPI